LSLGQQESLNMEKKEQTTQTQTEEKTQQEDQNIVEDYTKTLQRLQADFDNHIKRTKKEKEELEKYATAKLAVKLLNVADDFERTMKLLNETQDKKLTQGLEMVQKHLFKILEEEGIKQINAKGNKFDPFKHEIIDLRNGEKDDMVIEELQKGYTMHDKVLRTSKVIVSKKEEK